jgi:outer membrane lipopolysaccharide assembly protein LptE/RlpB
VIFGYNRVKVNEASRDSVVQGLTSVIVILIFCSLAPGCGYHFRPAGSPLNVDLESIAIPPFSGTSSHEGTEDEITKVVRQKFMSQSRVRIHDEAAAQAVLKGRLYSITTEPLAYTVTQQTIDGFLSTDEVTESRILRVRLEVTVTDMATRKIIWEDSNLTEKAIFQVSSDPLTTQYNQRMALRSIAQELATRIFSRTMERF